MMINRCLTYKFVVNFDLLDETQFHSTYLIFIPVIFLKISNMTLLV